MSEKNIHGRELSKGEARSRMNEIGLFPPFSLKFRYFDAIIGNFAYSREFKWENPFTQLQHFFKAAALYAKSIDQWTGLQDKGGVDIYTSDVVNVVKPCSIGSQCNTLQVKFGIARRRVMSLNGADFSFEVDIPSFYFEHIGHEGPVYPIVQNAIGGHDLDIMEVVGNMYQWEPKV